MTAAARERLFFALWPDDDTQSALAGIAKARLPAAGGRLIRAQNLHLTLVFLGSVDAGARACAERAAASLRAPAFELEFRRLGYWPRPRLLWSAPEQVPEGLTMLESMLRDALSACGHAPESRPFRAHITLARKLRSPLDDTSHAPIRWPVSDFHLVASQTLANGARYQPLVSWPLE
jgi:2'-5' RNA ligase